MHPIWGEYVSMGSKQLHLVFYVKYTHSLLGSLKGPTTARIEALTFTSPALNLRSRSKITEPYLITFELSKMDIYLDDISLKLYVIYLIT